MTHSASFFQEVATIAAQLDHGTVEAMAQDLVALRERDGRLFFLGVGGSAGNCGHAVNDFRKLCGIETYAPTDNVSELTARANDEGWDTIFSAWLKVSRLGAKDALFILSVGGGNAAKNVSPNLVTAIDLAKERGAKIFAIVGKPDGHAAAHADQVVVIPQVNAAHITPLSEAYQAVVWHCLVCHPALQQNSTKW